MFEIGFCFFIFAQSSPSYLKNCLFSEKLISCSNLCEIYGYLILALLFLLALQSIRLYRFKKQTAKESHFSNSELTWDPKNLPSQKDLPNPGLTYRFIVSEISPEKIITIGQKNGTVKTFSTEITDEHLRIRICRISSWELGNPGYRVEMQRGGKVLYSLPGFGALREMPHQIQFFIDCHSPTGEPSFKNLTSKDPLRLRLGDKLTHTQKFLRGYLEFHLFAKESAKTPKTSKEFYLKLFRIYPGYDTASQNEEGLFPMLEPFQRE